MGWLAVRLSGIPVWITSRRDLGFKRKRIYDKIFRLTSKDCKKCIANCNAVKDKVIQQENLPPEKIEVIYNGLDLSEYRQTLKNESLREELGVVNGTLLVGLIANFNFEIKGHIYFLGAAKKILEKVPDAKFVLVGDGPLRPRYQEVARELNLNNNVYFLGKRTDVPTIISNLDVSVLSSINEGFSNVILESMAASKPVVATKVGGSPEMVTNGVTGYLVPPADSQSMANAIIKLLQNPDEAKTMGAAGRKIVQEKFTVEAMVKSYERLYVSLLEDRG
jgi:glycosyltransferase involved in cell wall biosynthesis